MTKNGELAVLQWNVNNTTPADQVSDHLAKLANAYGSPHITCLEEVLKGADKSGSFAVNHRFREKSLFLYAGLEGEVEGISVESSLENTSYEEVELSVGDPIMSLATTATRRMCQLASYRVPAWDEEVRVAHVHLSPQVPLLNSRQRRSEEDGLIDIVREEAEKGHFLLTGDFNVQSSSRLVKVLKRLGMTEPANGLKPTYRVRLAGLTVKKLVLDHMMISKDLAGESVTVLPKGPSDHNPVLSQIVRRD